ncbi:DUF4304 domain-containing protein [Flavobacterium sp. 140616W15]|uniref:DUF4304 domain-containing protein n=1 Tax=Flavobacterium sp. 140616W15 TaxID=2478552 RepID=UPI00352A9B21
MLINDSKEFKDLFDSKANGFSKAFGGWYKQSTECISILELQKSNFGDNLPVVSQSLQIVHKKIYRNLSS